MKYIFEDSIGMLSAKVSRKLGQGLESQFSKKGFNINSVEWTMLSYLANKGAMTQKELSFSTGRNKVFIKRLVDKLEKRGLVKRTTPDSDKRVNQVKLTLNGTDHYKELLPVVESYIGRTYNHLSNNERENLVELLKKILLKI